MKNIVLTILLAALALTAVLLYFNNDCESERIVSPQKVHHLRFGHNLPENSALHQTALRFATLVKEKSRGQVEVEIFPDQQLGNDHQMIEMARAGDLDIILTPTAKLSTLVPEMQYVDLPFLFPSREDAYYLLDGDVGRLLLEHLSLFGLHGVTIWENGFKHFTANKPIVTPADFRGMKIRTMKSKIIMDQFKTFGATPIPIDFHTAYQALKDGVVDGQENTLVAIASMKFYEVQSNLILSGHAYCGYVLSFSANSLKNLPAYIREMLIDTAQEITPWERLETVKREKEFLQTIKEYGTTISTLTKEQRRQFQDATKNIAQKFRDIIGHDIMSLTEFYMQEKYGQERKDNILIGLDADMSMGSARAGMAIKRGMELAVEEINEKGGVLGKNLSIVVLDHKTMPARGKSNFMRFVGMANLVAVMGGKQSGVDLPEAKLAQQEKLPFLLPWSAATDLIDNTLAGNFVFRLAIRDYLAGDFLVDKSLKVSDKVGLLLENTAWGRSNEKAMTAALTSKGVIPAATAWFNWGDQDMSPQLSLMEKAEVGVVLLVANSTEGVNVLKSMAQRSHKIPIIAHMGILGGYFEEETKKERQDIDVSFLQTNWFLDEHRPEQKRFLQAYKAAYGLNDQEQIIAPPGSVHAYDLVHILAIAIKIAGSTDRSDIRNALEGIDSYTGVLKRYQPPFSPGNHEALDLTDYRLAKYDDQGRIKVIKAEE